MSDSWQPHGLQRTRLLCHLVEAIVSWSSPMPSPLWTLRISRGWTPAPEFLQIPVPWVGDAIQPSHPLSPPSLPALNLSQHQGGELRENRNSFSSSWRQRSEQWQRTPLGEVNKKGFRDHRHPWRSSKPWTSRWRSCKRDLHLSRLKEIMVVWLWPVCSEILPASGSQGHEGKERMSSISKHWTHQRPPPLRKRIHGWVGDVGMHELASEIGEIFFKCIYFKWNKDEYF